MRVFAVVLIVLISSVSSVSSREVVTITNGEWPPYLSKHLADYGAASRIVVKAFEAVGVKVDYMFRPWKRSYRYAKEGKGEGRICHGSVVWVYTPERAESFNYSDVVIEDTEVLFHLKSKPLKWRMIKDLRGKKIGGTLHTTYPALEKAERAGLLEIHRAGNYDTLFQRLLAGRIDAVPQVRYVGRHYIENTLKANEKNLITYSPTVVDHRKYHLIFSKKADPDQHFLTLFNTGLRKIRQNGVYQQVLNDLNEGKYYITNAEGTGEKE